MPIQEADTGVTAKRVKKREDSHRKRIERLRVLVELDNVLRGILLSMRSDADGGTLDSLDTKPAHKVSISFPRLATVQFKAWITNVDAITARYRDFLRASDGASTP